MNRTQSSFSESFFSFFNWRYFLFHHSPLFASKYHFANSTRTVLAKGFWRGNCNSVRWINRTQSRFSEIFFPVCNRRYFLFHLSPLWDSKYHFANCTRTVLAKGFLRGKLNSLSRINRTQSSLSESFFKVFILGYFLFHHSSLWASKYHFANFRRTV